MKQAFFCAAILVVIILLCSCGNIIPHPIHPSSSTEPPQASPSVSDGLETRPAISASIEPSEPAKATPPIAEELWSMDTTALENIQMMHDVRVGKPLANDYAVSLRLEGLAESIDDLSEMVLTDGVAPIPQASLGREDIAGLMDGDGNSLIQFDKGRTGFTRDGYRIDISIPANSEVVTLEEAQKEIYNALVPIFGSDKLENFSTVLDDQGQWDVASSRWLTDDEILFFFESDSGTALPFRYQHDHDGILVDDLNEGLFGDLREEGVQGLEYAWHSYQPQSDGLLSITLQEALETVDEALREPERIVAITLVYSNVTNVDSDGRKYDLHWRITGEFRQFYINCLDGRFWRDTNS